MPTVRIDFAYDGSGFSGYARQDGLRTIQGELETVLATLLGSVPDIAVAGRTDAGVHARGQVVSFATAAEPDCARLRRSLNGLLGPEVSVARVVVVDDGFHARHSATWRRYRYRMGTSSAPDPLMRSFTWEVGADLDHEAMAQVAAMYLGQHDFSSFCRFVAGKSNIRRVEESDLVVGDETTEYWIRANAFCHQMVRSLVGHMYDVGRGFSALSDVGDVIAARDRSRVATVAPPHGLTLWEVGY